MVIKGGYVERLQFLFKSHEFAFNPLFLGILIIGDIDNFRETMTDIKLLYLLLNFLLFFDYGLETLRDLLGGF